MRIFNRKLSTTEPLKAGKKYGAEIHFNRGDSLFKPMLTLLLALILVVFLLPKAHAEPRLVNSRQIEQGASPCNSSIPALSARGQMVAFESDCDWVGNNPFHNTEIFVMDIDGSNPIQITNGATSSSPYLPSYNAGLDASGGRLAFLSFADLLPGQNADMNSDIFRSNSDGTELLQLTNTIGGAEPDEGGKRGAHCCPAIDYAGRTIVFVSPFNPTDNNKDLGHTELWIVNWDGSGLRRLTHTVEGQNGWPVFDAAGRVYFISHENWNGENPAYSVQIFRIDPKTGEVEQMSHSISVEGEDQIGRMGVDASGRKIIFPMATVRSQEGSHHMELYLLDTKTGEIDQLTQNVSARGCFMTSMSASGKRVAFSCGILNPNPSDRDNEAVFIADVVY
jgi:Tol biopolymer transport system component